jgi:hypothetical protein
MYEPPTALIPTSPVFKTQRLGEIELGRLVLLCDSSGTAGGAALGLRVEALSARGDLSEGVLRLGGGPPRFERRALADTLIALVIDYVLEADLASAAVRDDLSSGDLVVAPNRPVASMYVASLWQGSAGLLDLASAIIRPFSAPASPAHVVFAWKLVDRDHPTRTLFEHVDAEPPLARRLPRRISGEDCD